MASHDGAFHVKCQCGQRREIWPGEVLLCPRCDCGLGTHTWPNAGYVRDAPHDVTHWAPDRSG